MPPETTYEGGIFSATGEKELEQAINDLGRDIDEFASLSSYSPSDTRPLISGMGCGDASTRRNLWYVHKAIINSISLYWMT